MATKIGNKNILNDIQRIAAEVVKSNGTNKGLFHTGAVMAIQHANETGDYTNTIVPLAIASRSFSANLFNRAIGFFERTTKVRFNVDNKPGGALKSVFDKGQTVEIEKLFKWDKEAKPEPIEAGKRWDSYTRPQTDKAIAKVDVPAKVKRLIDSLQEAINNHTAIGSDGKPVKLATIQRMITDAADKLTLPQKIVDAKTSDGRDVTILKTEEAKPETKAKVKHTAKPVTKASALGEEVKGPEAKAA